MPMTFDTYSNCAHQCVYCFSFFQRAVGEGKDDYMSHKVRVVDVERVKRMFTEPDKYARTFAWYIKDRMVLQWGGLSDGFDWYERTFRKSLELLRFFVEIDYPISISTKGVWFTKDPEYIKVLTGAKNVHFKVSIITADDNQAKILEPGTPLPGARFDALKRLNDMGIGATTMRFRPYVIGSSDKTADVIVKKAKETGCYSLTTEFLCLETRASKNARDRYNEISRACGFDVFGYYKRHSSMRSGLLRLNYEVKRPHIERVRALCEENGIKFFVSDAHHKEASEGTGCCGLPDTGPLSRMNRGQFAEAMQIAKRDGVVRWSQIAKLAEPLGNIPYYAAEGFNIGTTRNRAQRRYQTMFDYMHDVWNSPEIGMSPARYFGGVLVPHGTDENGDIVYLYNRPLVDGKGAVKSGAELRLKLLEAKERLREDGAKCGHVAFPIYLLNGADEDTVKRFGAERLSPFLCVSEDAQERTVNAFHHLDVVVATTESEVDAHCKEDGVQYYWLCDGAAMDVGERTIRAVLSECEAKMVGADIGWAKLRCAASL